MGQAYGTPYWKEIQIRSLGNVFKNNEASRSLFVCGQKSLWYYSSDSFPKFVTTNLPNFYTKMNDCTQDE